jgi:hypothetical protein
MIGIPRRWNRSSASARPRRNGNDDRGSALTVRQLGIGAVVEQELDRLEHVVAADCLMERRLSPPRDPVRIGAALEQQTRQFGVLRNAAAPHYGGVMTDLNSLLPANSGWHLVGAFAINDSGQIAGYGFLIRKARSTRFSWTLRPSRHLRCCSALASWFSC